MGGEKNSVFEDTRCPWYPSQKVVPRFAVYDAESKFDIMQKMPFCQLFRIVETPSEDVSTTGNKTPSPDMSERVFWFEGTP